MCKFFVPFSIVKCSSSVVSKDNDRGRSNFSLVCMNLIGSSSPMECEMLSS